VYQQLDYEMIILSILLFLFVTYSVYSELKINKWKLESPLLFFSLMFYGYVFSGIYFSFKANIHNAKFLNFVGNFSQVDLKHSLIQVITSYLFFYIGYKVSNKIKVKKVNLEINIINYKSNFLIITMSFLFLLSFLYWLYTSYQLANGPIDLLFKIGIYKHLLKDNYISTLPYNLAYATTSILYLIYLKIKNKIPIYVKLFILISFFMYLSKGRLSGAISYLCSYIIIGLLFHNRQVRISKLFYNFLIISIILFLLYFYRYYTVMYYIHKNISYNFLDLIGKHMFGMANVGDLQSIVLADKYIQNEGYLYGLSFLDFLRYWFSIIIGDEISPISVGIRFKQYFFNHEATGAPAPGIISEAIINFGYVGTTIFMLFLGVIVRLISRVLDYRISIINLYVYVKFLLFLVLFVKVDSSLLNSLIWSLLPIFILYICISVVVSAIRNQEAKKVISI